MAPVSDDRGLSKKHPGETESSSAGTQLDKGYPGRRWADDDDFQRKEDGLVK